MTPRELEEYRELRATIRERGTARVWVFVAGLVAWGSLGITTAALAALPVATLLPLLVLAGVFEAVVALHVGVERIGRYIQVFFEDDEGDRSSGKTAMESETGEGVSRWETTAMAYGAAFPGGGDPLFAPVFMAATVLNFVPVLVEPVAADYYLIGAAHLLVLARIFVARRQAGRQRAADRSRFQQLKNRPPTSAPAQ